MHSAHNSFLVLQFSSNAGSNGSSALLVRCSCDQTCVQKGDRMQMLRSGRDPGPVVSAEGSDWLVCWLYVHSHWTLREGSVALRLSCQEWTVPFRYHIPPKLMQHSWTKHNTAVSTVSLQQYSSFRCTRHTLLAADGLRVNNERHTC